MVAAERESVLERAQVLCATLAGLDDARLMGKAGKAGKAFGLVVIDEAAQALDPMTLAALGLGERLVLAGDPEQLPPTVLDVAVAREGLASTLFERLAQTRPELVAMLKVQYRMHEALMRFPSAASYGGELSAAKAVAQHALGDLGVRDDAERPHPLCFIDTAGKGWGEARDEDDPSTCNPLQAERTCAEVLRLTERGLPPTQIAVITPYLAQARLLRERLRPLAQQGLEIGTVDGFQGREKEAIVLDLVRSNERAELGFLNDTRRMNVALTRAKRFLLVLGDSATLAEHSYYKALLAHAEQTGAYLSAWEAEP
jgi:predicted DNA helicase